MLDNKIICNNCKNTKKEANHWYAVIILKESPYTIHIVPLSLYKPIRTKKLTEHHHICGERCLHETLSKNLPGL